MRNQKSTAGSLGTFAALLWVNIAYSQTPIPPDRGQNVPAYCEAAAAIFHEGVGELQYAKVKEVCRPGDTIGINVAGRQSPIVVARLCDFTKPVVSMGSEVICILGNVRDVRK